MLLTFYFVARLPCFLLVAYVMLLLLRGRVDTIGDGGLLCYVALFIMRRLGDSDADGIMEEMH